VKAAYAWLIIGVRKACPALDAVWMSGSREENASNEQQNLGSDFNRNGKGSNATSARIYGVNPTLKRICLEMTITGQGNSHGGSSQTFSYRRSICQRHADAIGR
jgi:hypothetical protein